MAEKIKRPVIKKLAADGTARDITRLNEAEALKFRAHHKYEIVYKSYGVHGANGALLRDSKGEVFAITARNAALCVLAGWY